MAHPPTATATASAVAAMDAGELSAELAAAAGNGQHFEKTVVGWAALRNDARACALALEAGVSPNAVAGSLSPLLLALATNAPPPICYALAAAGATMVGSDRETADEWVRLLCSTRDVPLIKTLARLCGLPRPTDTRCLMYRYVHASMNSVAAMGDVADALAVVRALKPATRPWWRRIHPGQRVRVLAFLRCMARGRLNGAAGRRTAHCALPPELGWLVLSFLHPTVDL